MPRLHPIIPPNEPEKKDNRINLATNNDFATYTIGGADWVNIQTLSGNGAGIGGAILTLQVSIDGANWGNPSAGATTISAFGTRALVTVTGFNYVKLYVSTAGGSDYAVPLVTAGITNG